MDKYTSIVWAGAVTLIAFMIIVFLTCQRSDDRVQECIKLGRAPRECACVFSPGTTSGCPFRDQER